MGYLTKITKEYFGDNTRKEDGKLLNVKGCKVLVPVEFSEDDFLHLVRDITETNPPLIIGRSEKRHYTHYFSEDRPVVETGSGYMVFDSFDEFMENTAYAFEEEVDEKMYETYVKFMGHLVKNVDFMEKDGDDYILLVDDGVMNNFHMKFYYEDACDDEEWCFDELMSNFMDEFGNKANIIKDEIEYIFYYDDPNIVLKLYCRDSFQFQTLLYAMEMEEWWDETMKTVLKTGVRKYFGIENTENQ